MQTALEAEATPTLHLLLPMLETVKTQLQNLQSGMSQGAEFVVPHACTQEFAGYVLSEIQNIELHDMWAAGCLLHPRMRNLSFIHDHRIRSNLKTKGCALIRRMMSKVTKPSCEVDSSMNIDSREQMNFSVIAPNALGENGFRLEDAFDAPDSAGSEEESLAKYLSRAFPNSTTRLLNEKLGIARFWISQNSVTPELSKVALHLFATPVSSSSSDRNFSAVNRIVTADRSKITPDILEDLLCAKTVQNCAESA